MDGWMRVPTPPKTKHEERIKQRRGVSIQFSPRIWEGKEAMLAEQVRDLKIGQRQGQKEREKERERESLALTYSLICCPIMIMRHRT